MDPSAVANLQYCDELEELQEIYGPLQLQNAELIILPINDNQNPLKLMGGTHWALLVYYKNNANYLDSSGGIILNTHNIAMKIKSLVKKEKTEEVLSESYLIEVLDDLPRQTNSYDCGIYMLLYVETILNLYLEKPQQLDRLKESSQLYFYDITPELAQKKREEIKAILYNLIQKKSSIKVQEEKMQIINNLICQY